MSRTFRGGPVDRDELFVVGRCAAYLERLIGRFPLVVQRYAGVLHLAAWVFEPARPLEEFFVSTTGRKCGGAREGGKPFEDDADADLDDRARNLLNAVRRLDAAGRARFVSFMADALKRTAAASSRRGQSEYEKRLEEVRRLFHLTEHETELLAFLVITSAFEVPKLSLIESNDMPSCTSPAGRKYLAAILGVGTRALERALDGAMGRAGLVSCSCRSHATELNDAFTGLLFGPGSRKMGTLFFRRLARRPLPLASHPVDPAVTRHVVALLMGGRRGASPAHVLLYGPPGTGKSSYAAGVVEETGLPAYEIQKSGVENATLQRRAAIAAALNMAGAVIVVDEADAVLGTGMGWERSGETRDKGWLDDVLEAPGARMIWIVNSTDWIDESVMRRFAFSLCFKAFNRAQRAAAWASVLRHRRAGRSFSPSEVEELARRHRVSPGVIDMAVKKAVETCGPRGPGFKEAVTRAIEAHETLRAGGRRPADPEGIECAFGTEGLNVDGDLDGLLRRLDGLERRRPGSGRGEDAAGVRVLFHGPPGTGKSELARHVAIRLGRELVCKRASEILDKFIGESEKSLDRAFREAEAEEAVLVIDEADTFLFDRRGAVRSWEVSLVNEFLTQMERFQGILICTTNRLEGLDGASMRRFNYKVGFKLLTPDGNVVFYRRLLAGLAGGDIDRESEAALRAVEGLAPGDFRIVRDRFPPAVIGGGGKPGHAELVGALREEARAKKTHAGEKGIGFSTAPCRGKEA